MAFCCWFADEARVLLKLERREERLFVGVCAGRAEPGDIVLSTTEDERVLSVGLAKALGMLDRAAES